LTRQLCVFNKSTLRLTAQAKFIAEMDRY